MQFLGDGTRLEWSTKDYIKGVDRGLVGGDNDKWTELPVDTPTPFG